MNNFWYNTVDNIQQKCSAISVLNLVKILKMMLRIHKSIKVTYNLNFFLITKLYLKLNR
jgi:hypothetical protein